MASATMKLWILCAILLFLVVVICVNIGQLKNQDRILARLAEIEDGPRITNTETTIYIDEIDQSDKSVNFGLIDFLIGDGNHER